jgi:PAS domain S-box-containing protein
MNNAQDASLAGAIVETVRLPLLALDENLRVQTANNAFLSQFRVDRPETVGRLVYDLGDGQWDIPDLRRLLDEILTERESVVDYRVEHEFERIGRRIMQVNAWRIARTGNPDLILLSISDETEREGLQAALKGQIELAEKLIDSVREGLIILDRDLRVRSASAAFHETFAVAPSETGGRKIYELGNGQWDIPALRRLLEDVLPRENSFDDYEVAHAFETLGERVLVLNGRRLDHVDLIVLAIRDVTESRGSAARLKEVAQAARIGVLEADLLSGALYWSPEMRDIVGWPQDAPPTPPAEIPPFVLTEDRPGVEEMYRRMCDPDGDGAVVHEHRIVRPDGETRWVRIHAQTEFADVAGERRAIRLRGLFLDVTEQRRAEATLREARERQAFLLELSDALRDKSGSCEIVSAAASLLGRHMGVSRVLFAEFDEARGVVDILHGWFADGAEPFPAMVRLEDFEGRILQDLRAGRIVRVEDTGDPAQARPDFAALAKVGVGGMLGVPLLANGGLRAKLSVHQHGPRAWTDAEAALVQEVAERLWAEVVRVRAEAAQRAEEARYRGLFNSIDEGFCTLELRFDEETGQADYRVLEGNPGFFRLTGFSGNVIGAWARTIAPNLDESWYDRYGRVARTGEPIRFEHHAEETDRWFDVYAFRIGGAEDKRVALLFADITERKRSDAARLEDERRLSEAQRRQEVAAEAAGMGIWEWILPEDRAIWEDGRIYDIFGISRDGPPLTYSELLRDVIHPQDRGELGRALERVAETGAFRATCRIRRVDDGAERWIEYSGQAEFDNAGQLARLVGTVVDVTDRKRDEERLRDAQQRQRLATEAAGIGVWEWRFDERGAVWDDPRIYEIFGVAPDAEPVDAEAFVENFLVAEDREGFERNLEKGWQTGTFRGSWRIRRASDGEIRWIEVSGHCEKDAEGRRARIVGVIADVTERKRAEAHQDMLMAELDHRVKNVLAVVQSIAKQSFARGGPDMAERLVARIGALAQSHALLASSRWEGARFRELFEIAVKPYRRNRNGHITAEGPDLQVTPKAAQTLTLAFHELVTNAAKYGALSCEHGRLSVAWHLEGPGRNRRLVLNWEERDGPPIEATPGRHGFGSLLLRKTLAYELKGVVAIDYARDGLKVRIELPVSHLRAGPDRKSAPPRPATVLRPGEPDALHGRRVLVVEDEYLVAQETIDALEGFGCAVVGPAGTLEDALRLAAADEIDVAILDVNLHGGLAWPVARILQVRGIPFAFATGYADTVEPPPDLADAPRLDKPLQVDRLVRTMASMVAQRSGS